jgi:transposase-like protein
VIISSTDQGARIVTSPSPFKWRHFEGQLILLCVRWYLRYCLSYRDLEEMMPSEASK